MFSRLDRALRDRARGAAQVWNSRRTILTCRHPAARPHRPKKPRRSDPPHHRDSKRAVMLSAKATQFLTKFLRRPQEEKRSPTRVAGQFACRFAPAVRGPANAKNKALLALGFLASLCGAAGTDRRPRKKRPPMQRTSAGASPMASRQAGLPKAD